MLAVGLNPSAESVAIMPAIHALAPSPFHNLSAADVCGTQGAACGSCSWLNLLGAPGVSIAIGLVRTGSRSKPEALFMRVFGMQVKHDSQSHSRLTIHDCQ
jgi:hypothetical protein